MFISVLELFKVGIGPSSSHTMGPMVAAHTFVSRVRLQPTQMGTHLRCTLKDSLAHTGIGHSTNSAIILGLHGYLPEDLSRSDVDSLTNQLQHQTTISLESDSALNLTLKNPLFLIHNTHYLSIQMVWCLSGWMHQTKYS